MASRVTIPSLHHAWFSQTFSQEFGFALYYGANGKKMMVSVVSIDPNFVFNYPDKKYLGKVKKLIRYELP